MCGIAGIVSYSTPAPIDIDELVTIQRAMASRGPDGANIWVDGTNSVGLAHTRLAIIDLSVAGNQPMISADGNYIVTFNGEIYNYRALKQQLLQIGHRFRTQSDTEVLLELYKAFGENMLTRLRGMYAFAIWDVAEQRLFAARDPFGIKPFYYADDGRTFRFASQVKALAKGEGIRLTRNPAGHAGFFLLGHLPEPHTLYREIRALPAGCALTLRRNAKPLIRRYYDITQKIVEAEGTHGRDLPDSEQIDAVSAALRDSLKHHLVSDVPVGVFLSAGIDSNAIAITAASEGSERGLVGVTMAFREFEGTPNDEAQLASAQAKALGIPHSVHHIHSDDFFHNTEQIWSAMDQPSIDGVNSWLVAKVAAESGLKVCLSGLGGDELFGGYPSFREIPKLVQLVSSAKVPSIGKQAWSRLVAFMPERWLSPKYAALFRLGATPHGAYLLRRGLFGTHELASLLDPETIKVGLEELNLERKVADSIAGVRGAHAAVSAMELSWYMRNQLLRDTDWASMAHGLEVRTPLVDIGLFEALLPLLVSRNPPCKDTLAKAAGPQLLSEIRKRPKTGFITPVAEWLNSQSSGRKRRGLRGWACATYARFANEASVEQGHEVLPKLSGKRPTLVFRIGQLGDAAVTLPALSEIRRQAGDRPIVLVTDRPSLFPRPISAWDVIGPTGTCDAVLFYGTSDGLLDNAFTRWKLMRKIRALDPYEIVNLAPRMHTRELLRDRLFFQTICGARRYRDFFSGPNGTATSDPEWRLLLRAVAPAGDSINFTMSIPRWAINEATSALSDIAQYNCLIGIAPGSRMPSKRWPTERYREFGLQLLGRRPDAALVILGGPEDHALADDLQHSWGKRSLNLCGRLSIFGSVAVLRRSALFVGNDSGAMHLAGLTGTPCVALFSARDVPGKWNPFGERNRVLRKEVECAGCMLTICPRDNLCLTKIDVEEVLQASQEFFAHHQSGALAA